MRRPVPGHDVLVLCYHGVSEHWPSSMSITPELLEKQVALLVGRGYVGATFSEAITSPPARRTFALTFDDAFRSVFELAYPLLSRARVPATLFVPTEQVGGGLMAWPGIDEWLGGPYEQELEGMTWDQIGELASAGWEIGSHTRSHPRLPELDDGALADELEGSRADCADRLGSCDSLAYPYGRVDERVVDAARVAGYRTAASLPYRKHEPPRLLRWPRTGIFLYDDLPRFRRKVSRPLRVLRASRAWPLLDSTRQRIRGR
jgi:peptidoglycan/xylan/chitin deacetylase (PgdA/CDA1 family)